MFACAPLWHAQIGVLVPAGHAERNALIQLLEARAFGRCIHGADQFVAVLSLPVEQRSRPRGIEGEAFQVSVPIVREMILSLREIRREDVEAVGQSNAIIPVSFDRFAQSSGDFIGAALILISRRVNRRHAHVRAVHVVVMGHRLHHASLGMIARIIFHVHAGHTAVVLMLMGGIFPWIRPGIGMRRLCSIVRG